MHHAISPSLIFTLAIGPGVSSSRLSALFALQRAHEPDVVMAVREVANQELVAGLHEGRYDAGISLRGAGDHQTSSRRLWSERMAAVVPCGSPMSDKATLAISELQTFPVLRWGAEVCTAMDHDLLLVMPESLHEMGNVTSFEMMALLVRAGFGVGVPYEIDTYMLRPNGRSSLACDQFECRALQVATVQAW